MPKHRIKDGNPRCNQCNEHTALVSGSTREKNTDRNMFRFMCLNAACGKKADDGTFAYYQFSSVPLNELNEGEKPTYHPYKSRNTKYKCKMCGLPKAGHVCKGAVDKDLAKPTETSSHAGTAEALLSLLPLSSYGASTSATSAQSEHPSEEINSARNYDMSVNTSDDDSTALQSTALQSTALQSTALPHSFTALQDEIDNIVFGDDPVSTTVFTTCNDTRTTNVSFDNATMCLCCSERGTFVAGSHYSMLKCKKCGEFAVHYGCLKVFGLSWVCPLCV